MVLSGGVAEWVYGNHYRVSTSGVFTDCFRLFRSDYDILRSDQIRSDCAHKLEAI